MKNLNKDLLRKNIEEIAEYDLSNNKIFGSAYLVFQKDEVVFEKCFGYTSLDSKNPVTDKTLFRLASMTKPITALATLILVEQGLLSLSDPISKYLPEFANVHVVRYAGKGEFKDDGKTNKIPTICNLLTHTSGIGSDDRKNKCATDDERSTLDKYIQFLLKSGLDFEPESHTQYSGLGAFDVLTKIIELVSKTDYLEFLKKEIFEPCDMVDTTFTLSDEQWGRMIPLHNKVDEKSVVSETEKEYIFGNFPSTHYLGGGGLASTLSDYTKFALMLLNKGKIKDKQIVSEETFNLLPTAHVSPEIMPGNQRWGLGVRVITDESYKYLPVNAYGWSGAYGSHFWVDPENEVVAVFMKNSLCDGGAGNESARKFEKAVHSSFEE